MSIAQISTKRKVIAHVSVCVGCCCGNTKKGKPAVPDQWLKEECARRLLKNVHLSICGCLGPCDVANVVKVNSAEGEIWLGDLQQFSQYRDLADWASACHRAERALPLPSSLARLQMELYRASSA
ncbi:MAG TPA: (2Fe-2S) ferredoxin domain-containing protein [Bryobacteraceae bacterium]|jgi:cobaltochelatase CobN|nr:(2Fe-2S) ferredoxin domain-containing protein [Bryobacteraceae bacterium]